jgi:cytochrome c-type biogenesis protein CcmH/NrfF
MRSLERVSAALALGLVLSSAALAQERYTSEDYRAACAALMCQCGCGATVANCAMEHCHSAEPIREEIATRLQAGESVESIIDVFVDRYGLIILSAPPAEGFHLTAWLTPFFVLLVGLFVVVVVLRSWKHKTAPAGEAPPRLSDAQRARIERELRDISS